MTLEITISPPVVRVTDIDGHEVLNITQKLFYAKVTDRIQTSLTTSVYNTGTNITVDHNLGSVSPSATFVRGSMTVTTYPSSGANYVSGAPVNKKFNISGTYVHIFTGFWMHTFTPLVSGGSLLLREKLISKQLSNTFGQIYQVGGVAMSFDVICGQFT